MTAEPVELALSAFEALIGQEFTVGGDGPDEGKIAMTLASVKPLRAHELRQEPFSLIFEGPVEPPLDQGTYLFTHEAIGAQPIFIVPISQDQAVRRYQAVFN